MQMFDLFDDFSVWPKCEYTHIAPFAGRWFICFSTSGVFGYGIWGLIARHNLFRQIVYLGYFKTLFLPVPDRHEL